MIRQIVTRIIRRAHDPNLELLENLLSRKTLQLVVGFRPDFRCGCFIQYLLDAEDSVELEMGPMPEGFLSSRGIVRAKARNFS